jgi:hypothetical protein
LVDGLFADPEPGGDVLPGPALGAGVVDLEDLQRLEQAAEGRDRSEAEVGVLAVGRRQRGGLGIGGLHGVKIS